MLLAWRRYGKSRRPCILHPKVVPPMSVNTCMVPAALLLSLSFK